MATRKSTAAEARRQAATSGIHVADICLYGSSRTGAGWIARAEDGAMFGDGEPRGDRSFTEAIWIAVGALEGAGLKAGRVRVFAPGGVQVAWMELTRPLTFGDLAWEAAPVYTFSAAELEAAATDVVDVEPCDHGTYGRCRGCDPRR